MYAFTRFNGLEYLAPEDQTMSLLGSFGNMGFSKAFCGMTPINWGDSDIDPNPHTVLTFQCETSTYITGLISSGILLDTPWGGEDETLRQCAPKESYQYTNYSAGFPSEKFEQLVVDKCQGKSRCNVRLPTKFLTQGLSSSRPMLEVFGQVRCQ